MVAGMTGALGGDLRVTATSTAGVHPSQGSAALAVDVTAFRRGEPVSAALDGRTQGLIQIAILAATGHAEDLPAHVERALGDGASPVDLIETMRVVGHFAGVPAASAASRAVEDVLRSHGLAFAGEAP
jgi:alkylhydroperoxidase/carboxymuconolactone decarboxylase family protein YurZ